MAELRSDKDVRAMYDEWQRQRMGELAAPDRYGQQQYAARQFLLPLRQSKDPVIDKALRQAGHGYEEGRPMGSNLHPDYATGQKPPPLPPTLQQQPSWTREAVDPDYFASWVAQPSSPVFDEDWT